MPTSLSDTIAELAAQGGSASKERVRAAFAELRTELAAGRVRVAEPDATRPGGWRLNVWVKQGILLGVRFGDLVDMGIGRGRWSFFDKDTLPLRTLELASAVRLAPGGSSVREGACLGKGLVCLPPSYVDVGAWIGEGTFVESHVLVGSCAQVGRRVRVGSGTMIGGALETVDAMPVIVEDDVIVGGGCGVFDSVIIKRRAVLSPGTTMTPATPLYDLPNGRIITVTPGEPLVVPEGAVVVQGARQLGEPAARDWGLSVATPVIVRYLDDSPHAG